MLQEFFKTTLISKYIKYLLSKSPVPVYKLIFDNDDMIEGCIYTYKNKILKCTKSGRFVGVRGSLKESDYLYVQELLRVNEGSMTITRFVGAYKYVIGTRYIEAPTDAILYYNVDEERFYFDFRKSTLFDTAQEAREAASDIDTSYIEELFVEQVNIKGEYTKEEGPFAVTNDVVGVQKYDRAEFVTIATMTPETYIPGQTETFISNSSYYDTETHYRLGEYLRYLNNLYDLDLMPLYNCFNYKLADTFVLDIKAKSNIISGKDPRYKTYLIPIKFDKTYTVALDCAFPVLMKAVFYNKDLVTDAQNQSLLSDYLDEGVVLHNNMQFAQPKTYCISYKNANKLSGKPTETYYPMLHAYEKYLYLAIQVPVDNTSTVVVLEGDYTRVSSTSVTDVMGIERENNTADGVSSMLTSDLSLLRVNDGQQHPFADKLIEYLCRNTIDTREYIDENVAYVENAVHYTPDYEGLWDDNIRYILFDRYMKAASTNDNLNGYDILGYVDSDIERAIRKGLLS